MNYYNEFDRNAAAWLRQLIADGQIPDGYVDERSISEVAAKDLDGFDQCHFFAGVGGWPLALKLAGWPEERPVWTMSCPCQPFSVAGKGLGRNDPRHLWPAARRLINRRRPPVIFGEQVASKAGRQWLAGVFANLETMGYAPAGADLCAAGVGAPHIRQRLFWVAHLPGQRSAERQPGLQIGAGEAQSHGAPLGGVADARVVQGGERHVPPHIGGREGHAEQAGMGGKSGGMVHTHGAGSFAGQSATPSHGQGRSSVADGGNGYWDRHDLLHCTDGKTRRIEPGSFPLVDGLPRGVVPSGDPQSAGYANATSEARRVRLKGYGNAISPTLTAQFIAAYMEV